MRLEKCKMEDLGSRSLKRTRNLKVLEEFANSDMQCTEVKEFTNKNAKSCRNSLDISIKRFHMTGIKTIERKGKVYLVKVNE